MNKSVLMIMGGALVVAILVAMIVQSRLSSTPGAAPATMTEILVANKKLMAGEKIKIEDTRWQPWPDEALYVGVMRKSDQPDPTKLTIADAPLRHDVEAGEPITDQ